MTGAGQEQSTDPSLAATRDHPQMAAEVGRVEPVPRRVRATLGGRTVVDTTRARYVGAPYYPQYYVPVEDIDGTCLHHEEREQRSARGIVRWFGLRAGDQDRPSSVRVFGPDATGGMAHTARLDWDALDAWYEEDEQVFVHPRDPYVRVDARPGRGDDDG